MTENHNYQISDEKLYHWVESEPTLTGDGTRRIYTKEHIPVLLRVKCTISTKNPTQIVTILKNQYPSILNKDDLITYVIDSIMSLYSPYVSTQNIIDVSNNILNVHSQMIEQVNNVLQPQGLFLEFLSATVVTDDTSLHNKHYKDLPNWIIWPIGFICLLCLLYATFLI